MSHGSNPTPPERPLLPSQEDMSRISLPLCLALTDGPRVSRGRRSCQPANICAMDVTPDKRPSLTSSRWESFQLQKFNFLHSCRELEAWEEQITVRSLAQCLSSPEKFAQLFLSLGSLLPNDILSQTLCGPLHLIRTALLFFFFHLFIKYVLNISHEPGPA